VQGSEQDARGSARWHTHLALLVIGLDLLDAHRPGGLCDTRSLVDLPTSTRKSVGGTHHVLGASHWRFLYTAKVVGSIWSRQFSVRVNGFTAG